MPTPAEKALWFVESHFADEVTLQQIAEAAGISRFHLVRAFGYATGHSVMQYVRRRRLSEAAKRLASGAPNILEVALDAGYGSHEAFSRAFKEQFGIGPERVRTLAPNLELDLQEPIKMNEDLLDQLEPPRKENGPVMLIAGLSERYDDVTSANIPAQQQRFAPHIGNLPNQIGAATYGVCYNSDNAGNIDYLSGVEVSDYTDLPPEFARLKLTEQRYVVFTHRDHISTIRRTVKTIWNKWLPESGLEAAEAPDFERYDEHFDPRSGNGGLEIWIPVKP